MEDYSAMMELLLIRLEVSIDSKNHLIQDSWLVIHNIFYKKNQLILISFLCYPYRLDLLWSDPVKTKGRCPSKRGISVGFGPDVSKKFLDDNNLGKQTKKDQKTHFLT